MVGINLDRSLPQNHIEKHWIIIFISNDDRSGPPAHSRTMSSAAKSTVKVICLGTPSRGIGRAATTGISGDIVAVETNDAAQP